MPCLAYRARQDRRLRGPKWMSPSCASNAARCRAKSRDRSRYPASCRLSSRPAGQARLAPSAPMRARRLRSRCPQTAGRPANRPTRLGPRETGSSRPCTKTPSLAHRPPLLPCRRGYRQKKRRPPTQAPPRWKAHKHPSAHQIHAAHSSFNLRTRVSSSPARLQAVLAEKRGRLEEQLAQVQASIDYIDRK